MITSVCRKRMITHNGKGDAAESAHGPDEIVPHGRPSFSPVLSILSALRVPRGLVFARGDVVVLVLSVPDTIHIWHQPAQSDAHETPESEVVRRGRLDAIHLKGGELFGVVQVANDGTVGHTDDTE